MRKAIARFSNLVTSLAAGLAAFVFTLAGFLMLRTFGEQVMGSVTIGLFALAMVWVAFEKPNSRQARAASALIDRLLAVKRGDLASPAPEAVRREMPALASAVEALFAQVRSNLDSAQAMAMYDPVTSLPNRLHFKREADRMLKCRQPDEQMALLFIDLDGFKEVNDNRGHAQGDEVLLMVADRLREVVRAEAGAGETVQPLLARLAGDEFTLLFPVGGAEEAERLACRALDALTEPYSAAGQRIDMGASIGVASCPRDGVDLTSLMKAADIAMYHAKGSGRSQVSVHNPALAAAFEERCLITRSISEGLQKGEFSLLFQPQLGARDCAVAAAEALIRWHHPVHGIRAPDSFLRCAEEGGLLIEIGDWMLASVAASLARWQAAGIGQRLSINISPRQIERADFFRRLREAMSVARSPSRLLELEISEASAMRCSVSVLAELGALRREGVSIAIGGFGSGYSNLARMKDLPIDRVRLDRGLIRDIDRSAAARSTVSAVIHLVHGLGCQAVAEGIERAEQLDVLRAVGCDCVQGGICAEPMLEEQFIAWVSSQQHAAKEGRRTA